MALLNFLKILKEGVFFDEVESIFSSISYGIRLPKNTEFSAEYNTIVSHLKNFLVLVVKLYQNGEKIYLNYADEFYAEKKML